MKDQYEIIYDYEDEWTSDYNCKTYFCGSWDELQEYIKQLREADCFNISATCISQW